MNSREVLLRELLFLMAKCDDKDIRDMIEDFGVDLFHKTEALSRGLARKFVHLYSDQYNIDRFMAALSDYNESLIKHSKQGLTVVKSA